MPEQPERQKISEFRKMTLNAQWPSDTEVEKFAIPAGMLIFRNLESGEIVAQMHADDLFDIHGNRFWLDA